MNIFIKLFGFNKYIDKINELEKRCEKLENVINSTDDNIPNVISGFNKYVDKINELEKRCEKLENVVNSTDDNIPNVISGDLFVSGSISATKEIAAFK